MRRPEFIARQSRCPTGVLGRLIGRIMAVETATANQHATQLLQLEPTDHVLDVGFGHGRSVQWVAGKVPQGSVAGVDISEEMMRMASRRNRQHIAAGRVVLKLTDGVHLPFPDASFEKAYAVHVLYFWAEPRRPLREVLRVLKAGGLFVIGFRARGDRRTSDFPASVYRFYETEEVCSLVASCGFRAITTSLSPDGTVFVSAER